MGSCEVRARSRHGNGKLHDEHRGYGLTLLLRSSGAGHRGGARSLEPATAAACPPRPRRGPAGGPRARSSPLPARARSVASAPPEPVVLATDLARTRAGRRRRSRAGLRWRSCSRVDWRRRSRAGLRQRRSRSRAATVALVATAVNSSFSVVNSTLVATTVLYCGQLCRTT